MKEKLEVYHFWIGHEHAPIKSFLDFFARKYSIEVRDIAMEWGIHSAITQAKVMRENPPDIVATDIGRRLADYVKTGEIAEVEKIWSSKSLKKAIPDWIKEACSVDGKIYGVPSKCFTFAVWYLKRVFKKYNLEPPESWDEFLEICKKLSQKGIRPIVSSSWEVSLWFENILVRFVGPDFYNALMRGEESWLDPRVIEAYETLRELSEYFLPGPFSYSFRESWEALNAEKAVMQLQGDWVNEMWKVGYGYKPGVDYDFFLIPPIDDKVGHVMITGGNAWLMTKRAPHKNEAKTFMTFAASKKAHEILAKEGMGIMSRIDVPEQLYDPVSLRLLKSLQKYPNVLQMDAILPATVLSVERLQQAQIVLGEEFSRKRIEALLEEIQKVSEGIRQR
ncbi:MAG: extracellular solute-binding protein [Candidatus Hadarchaeales archaeon]